MNGNVDEFGRALVAIRLHAATTSDSCIVEWFGMWKQIEVIASQGTFPLLGVGLLAGHHLEIDYKVLPLTIE